MCVHAHTHGYVYVSADAYGGQRHWSSTVSCELPDVSLCLSNVCS